jgi:hypothetical protein
MAAPAAEPWPIRGRRVALTLAYEGQPFQADDVADRAGVPDDAHTPNGRPSQMGAMFRQLKAEGWIRQTGRHQKSRQPHRKGGLNLEWVGTAKAQAQLGHLLGG